ncbi:hypothetical protein CR513_14457, partial [Mucuna pruriens]
MEQSMIDAASGGALMDKIPPAGRHLISNIASNTQARNIVVNNSSDFDYVSITNSSDFVEYSSTNISAEPGQMENNDGTLKELATPDVVYQPWCIQRRPLQTFERIPCGIPILLGWTSEGLAVSSTCSLQHLGSYEMRILGEVLFSIQNRNHEVGNLWDKATIKRNFARINEQLLIHYFYEGLSMMDRSMIDAASGEALMDKTPTAARHLISNMASNTQQFGIRGPSQSRMVNEIGTTSILRLENQLFELTSLVRQLVFGQYQPNMAAKVCGICTSVEHPTDLCPKLQETESDQPENVGAIGGYQYGKQPYQIRPFDNQQYGRQPFGPAPNQGPYAT